MDDPHRAMNEGDLLAYLSGEPLPHVVQALADSPALQAQLQEIQRADRQFARLFGGIGVPDPQDLVDVATGQASARQHLRVAAYLRESAAGRAEIVALLDPVPSPRMSRVPRWLGLPLQPAGTRAGTVGSARWGLRANPGDGAEQGFYISEIHAQVIVQVLPPTGEFWVIQGRVTQQNQPVAAAQVRLSHPERRIRPRTTDAEGFFSFQRLRAGTYGLQVHLGDGRVIVPDIVLADE